MKNETRTSNYHQLGVRRLAPELLCEYRDLADELPEVLGDYAGEKIQRRFMRHISRHTRRELEGTVGK